MPSIYYFLTGLHLEAASHPLIWWLSDPRVAVLLAVFIPCALVVAVILGVAGFSTYVERKVAADIQRRVGPNKCNIGSFFGEWARQMAANAGKPGAGFSAKLMGLASTLSLPFCNLADKLLLRLAPGIIIFMADGLKLIMKEDIIPDPVDRPLFKLAPIVVMISALGALAALPYSDSWYVADFNIGIFYIVAITSLEVLGILMAGWASNNKWALLGGMRSAAQIVSYELPVGLAIATGILLTGAMSMQAMTRSQLGWFWHWNIFNPFMFVLAPIYFLAALAECNRTPFDIPEAESELVSGYHTEYSGMRFGLFFMAEYTMMIVTSGIATALFLGGWSTGIAPLENLLQIRPGEYHWYGTLLHLIVFAAKTYGLVLVMMWIRWTLPRFRVDQMMELCWKKLIPLGVGCFFLVALWMLTRMLLVDKLGAHGVVLATTDLRAVFAVGLALWLAWYFLKKEKTA
jgi:NADH:ubiquinone oxidoreductase subunit H